MRAASDWLEAVLQAVESNVPTVLATVVRTVGSTPRREGARMVIVQGGDSFGSIGGGCGEAEVRRAALDVFDTGRPRLVCVDLRGFFGDDAEVCGGWMEVFLEPLLAPKAGEEEAG